MAICQAINKYGLNSFNLEILEYCSKDNVIEREQFYLDTSKPEYNILKIAGSRLGLKHSLLSRLKLSKSALGRIVSKETRLKLSESLIDRKLSELTKEKIRSYKHTEKAKSKISLGNPRTKSVQILDVHTNTTTIFPTMTSASVHLSTTTATIGSYIKSQKLYKDKFLISVLSKNHK